MSDYGQELADLYAQFDFVERSTTDASSRRETMRDNAGRQATAELTYVSTGLGQHRIAKALSFPVTFRSEPHLSTGCATVAHPQPKVWHDPIGTAGVYRWIRDHHGNYTGAKIWVRVDIHPFDETTTAVPPQVKTLHYLTFSAFAIKDLPSTAMDPQLTPRTVPLLAANQEEILRQILAEQEG